MKRRPRLDVPIRSIPPIQRRTFFGLFPLAQTLFAAGGMRLSLTSRGTYAIAWPGGNLELNLVPMSTAVLETSGVPVAYTKMRDDQSLYLPIADLVGITALQLEGSPKVPRILWDNREHHFWDGFEGSFEPRNVVANEPKVEADGPAMIRASYYYIANHVKTTFRWEFTPPAQPSYRANWTTTIEVENRTPRTLAGYMQFFACYHKAAENYYWDSSGKILPCPDGGFTATRDEHLNQKLRKAPYQTHMDRYREKHIISYKTYRQPLLMSRKEDYFGGLRHVTMSEPAGCAGVVTWNSQARDYMIRPPDSDLKPGESFRARIRHVIAPADSEQDVQELWREFETGVLKV